MPRVRPETAVFLSIVPEKCAPYFSCCLTLHVLRYYVAYFFIVYASGVRRREVSILLLINTTLSVIRVSVSIIFRMHAGHKLTTSLDDQIVHGILAAYPAHCLKPILATRHVVKFFLDLQSIDLELSLALLKSLDPGSKPVLNDRDINHVAAVIYVAVKLVDLVKHLLVILLRQSHVFLDHLYPILQCLNLNIIDLIIEFSLLVLLKFNHLIRSHLIFH
jgi:hypothetical protein